MSNVAKTYQNPKFDPTDFNKNFESKDQYNNNLTLAQQNLESADVEIITAPHKKPVETIILDIRDLFFQTLNIIEDKQNPLPYIFASDKRQFAFALFLIIFGTLLLLLSSLMKSSYDNK
jgi:hypothetical protein